MYGDVLNSETLVGNEPPSGGADTHHPIPPWSLPYMGDGLGKNLGTEMSE